ncbi:HU family DNA-binding protein [uncultured Duncaniella sp.]|uniref:HU family DNA-binding protein n=1 Tax=uncultured Duncaniella sp. TaxID=2768039 RepID=UPI0026595F43|nr:HU family DNA-binding protein [uncultured Duncaniella sp.]
MDNKAFNSRLAKTINRDPEETATLIDALGKLMAEIGTGLDSVAVPGFGTFITIKNDENVITDTESGRRTIVPQSIKMHFQPSVVLRKKLSR